MIKVLVGKFPESYDFLKGISSVDELMDHYLKEDGRRECQCQTCNEHCNILLDLVLPKVPIIFLETKSNCIELYLIFNREEDGIEYALKTSKLPRMFPPYE